MASTMYLVPPSTPVMVRLENRAAGRHVLPVTSIAASTSQITDRVTTIIQMKGTDVCGKITQSSFHLSQVRRLQSWASNDVTLQSFRSACDWTSQHAWLGGPLAVQQFLKRRTRYSRRTRIVAESAADDVVRMEDAHENFSRAQGVDSIRKGILGGIVSQAVSLFIKQQLEEWSDLRVRVGGGSKELLGGFVPSFALQTSGANFRGLILTKCDLAANNISVSLRNKSGGLFKRPFSARACVTISKMDLNTSVMSPLLQSSLQEIFSLSPSEPLPALNVSLQQGCINLNTSNSGSNLRKTCLRLDLSNDGRWLQITNVAKNRFQRGFSSREIDLGPETKVETLQIGAQGVLIIGTFQITPQ